MIHIMLRDPPYSDTYRDHRLYETTQSTHELKKIQSVS